MFYLYVIGSERIFGKSYIGHTQNLKNRIEKHNKGLVKSTKYARPWKILYTEEYSTKNEAYKRELQIKSYKGGEAFKKLLGNS